MVHRHGDEAAIRRLESGAATPQEVAKEVKDSTAHTREQGWNNHPCGKIDDGLSPRRRRVVDRDKYGNPKGSIEYAQMKSRDVFEDYEAKALTGKWIIPDNEINEYIRQINECMGKWKFAMRNITEFAKAEAKKNGNGARVDQPW